MEEEWRDIPGYEGLYQVSSLGRVRSVGVTDTCRSRRGKVFHRYHPGRVLSLEGNNSSIPYYAVQLFRDGRRKRFLVHRLVALAFLGPLPEGKEVRHLDNDYRNNAVDNLVYGTHSENMHDTIRDRRHSHKLTDDQVREIRSRLAAGESALQICKDYGVSDVVLSNIRLGRSYRYVTP